MQTSIPAELIFSHYWGVDSKPRLAVMYQSLDAFLNKIGNPEIKINDSVVFEHLLNDCARWFSMNFSSSIVNQVKENGHLNFEDFVFLIALSYNPCIEIDTPYLPTLIKTYFTRKNSGIFKESALYPEITNNTYGLLIYREQAVKMISGISGVTEDAAHLLVRNLRKGDAEAQKYGAEFIKLGVSNGGEETEVRKIWEFILLHSQMLLENDFSLALGWLLYQVEYLQTYYTDLVNRELEAFEKSHDITPIINTIKRKHEIRN